MPMGHLKCNTTRKESNMKTKKSFNLMNDPWIPATGRSSVASLRDLLEDGNSYESIDCPPMTRIAIIRLLQALTVFDGGDVNYFDLGVFLQVGGLPESSAREPQAIIDMSDGNSVAFTPMPLPSIESELMALALVTAYFCDRGGLKARVPGLPISAQMPAHVGRNIRMKRGNTIEDLLRKNPIQSNSEYLPPWRSGILEYPRHDTPRDNAELIMWPWRRLQVFSQGITIAPGAPINKTIADPWSDGKSKLSDLSEQPDDEFEVTRLVLNQALPIACWTS